MTPKSILSRLTWSLHFNKGQGSTPGQGSVKSPGRQVPPLAVTEASKVCFPSRFLGEFRFFGAQCFNSLVVRVSPIFTPAGKVYEQLTAFLAWGLPSQLWAGKDALTVFTANHLPFSSAGQFKALAAGSPLPLQLIISSPRSFSATWKAMGGLLWIAMEGLCCNTS